MAAVVSLFNTSSFSDSSFGANPVSGGSPLVDIISMAIVLDRTGEVVHSADRSCRVFVDDLMRIRNVGIVMLI